VVAVGDIKGIETEGGGVVGKVGESGIVVFFNLCFPMVVDRFFYHFNMGGGTGETFEHGYEAGVRCFSDGIGRQDHEWRGCGNVDWG